MPKSVDEILEEQVGEEEAQRIREENQASDEPIDISDSDSGSDSGSSSNSGSDSADVVLTDVVGEDGYRKTQDDLEEDLASGNTENLDPAPQSSQSAVEGSVENINEQSGLDREAPTQRERNRQTVIEDLSTTTESERQADVNLSGFQDSQGNQLTEREVRSRIAEGRTQNIEAGPAARTSRSAIIGSRRNRRENIIEERRQNQRRSSSNNNQLRLEVDGRTGKATEQGEEFYREQQRLREMPTFSLTQPSVAGELGVSIGNQLGEGSKTIADVAQDITGTEGDISTNEYAIPLTDKEIDVDNIFQGRGQPRQAFQETLAPLSVLQSRSNQFIDQQTEDTVSALDQPGLQDSGEIPTTGEAFVSGVTAAVGSQVGNNQSSTFDERFTESRQAQERITAEVNKKFAAEVPEKTTETASLIGAGAAGARNPERLAGELVAGSGQVARKSAEEPLDFAAGEFIPDITLDLATGGGVAIATPQVRAASTNARSRADAITQEVQSLREGAKNSPDPLTAAAEAAASNRPEQNVLTTDTATPTNQGPATTPGPETLETFEPLQTNPSTLEPLQTINTDARNSNLEIDANAGIAAGLTGSISESSPRADAINSPRDDSIAGPRTEIDTIAEPFTEPVSEPLTTAQPLVTTQAVAEPVTEPLTQPISEITPVTQPRTLGFEPEGESPDEDSGSGLFGTQQDLGLRRSVAADLLSIEGSTTAEEAESSEFASAGLSQAQNPFSLRAFEDSNGDSNTEDLF